MEACDCRTVQWDRWDKEESIAKAPEESERRMSIDLSTEVPRPRVNKH